MIPQQQQLSNERDETRKTTATSAFCFLCVGFIVWKCVWFMYGLSWAGWPMKGVYCSLDCDCDCDCDLLIGFLRLVLDTKGMDGRGGRGYGYICAVGEGTYVVDGGI